MQRSESQECSDDRVATSASTNRIAKNHPSLGFSAEDLPLSVEQVERLAARMEGWMIEWLVDRAGVNEDDIRRDTPFAEMGIDSLTAVELSQELEDWLKVKLTPVVAWNYPTPETLSGYLAREVGGINEKSREEESAVPEQPSQSDFEKLLAEIEALDDGEAQAALDDQED